MKLYGEISKTEAQADGTLKVEGFASSESVDSDGEIVTAEAMKAALPDYMKFGAVREMHQSKAAGTAIEAAVQDDGRTYFKAHIVDSEAVKKVNTGVYKGFSIGGKVTSRDELNKSTVTGLKLVEISLVDRPANQEAVFSLAKFEDNEDHDLKKYLGEQSHDVNWANDALNTVYALYAKELGESEQAPDQLSALKAVIDGLKEFISLEIKEPDDSTESDMFSYAATTDDFHKAGAEISAKNKEKMQQIHDHSVSMGASCSTGSAKTEGSDDLQKVQGEYAAIQKVYTAQSDALESIGKACDEAGITEGAIIADFIKSMKYEIEKLKSEPETPKVALNDKGIVVSKSEDSKSLLNDDPDVFVKDAKGNIDEAATLIKMSHRSGGIVRL